MTHARRLAHARRVDRPVSPGTRVRTPRPRRAHRASAGTPCPGLPGRDARRLPEAGRPPAAFYRWAKEHLGRLTITINPRPTLPDGSTAQSTSITDSSALRCWMAYAPAARRAGRCATSSRTRSNSPSRFLRPPIRSLDFVDSRHTYAFSDMAHGGDQLRPLRVFTHGARPGRRFLPLLHPALQATPSLEVIGGGHESPPAWMKVDDWLVSRRIKARPARGTQAYANLLVKFVESLRRGTRRFRSTA